MALEILSFFKRKPYFSTNADSITIRKVALDWAMKTGNDIVSCLQTETIDKVISLMRGVSQ